MGSLCCCLRDEWQEYANPNNSIYRNCLCIRCFLQNLIYMYALLFQQGEEHMRLASPSFSQRTSSFGSSASFDNSLSDIYRSPPRPLPYDTDPPHLRHHGLMLRREKGPSHSQEESEPLRSDSDAGIDSLYIGNKDGGNDMQTNSSLRHSVTNETNGFAHIYASSEDEDVCPTCLEEYTIENPKIITKCSHHFHLGCIYEWMERSETCPVCGKVMVFHETT